MLRFSKGIRHGHLVALENTSKKSSNNAYIWRFRCDCGNETEKEARVVKAGRTQSCGKCEYSKSLKGIRRAFRDKNKRAWIRLNDKLKTRAESDKQEYTLTPEFLEIIGKSNCIMCGTSPDHVVTGFRAPINRPARMRKEQGLIEGNVQSVCKECHTLVGGRSIDLVLEHHYRIQKHLKGK